MADKYYRRAPFKEDVFSEIPEIFVNKQRSLVDLPKSLPETSLGKIRMNCVKLWNDHVHIERIGWYNSISPGTVSNYIDYVREHKRYDSDPTYTSQ